MAAGVATGAAAAARLIAVTALLLLLLPGSGWAKKEEGETRRCGNREGAICCEAWGNTCIDPGLTCCGPAPGNTTSCIAAPYNASNPTAACPGSPREPNFCAFASLLQRTTNFSSANAYVLTVLAAGVYPYTWALQDDDEGVGRAFSTAAAGWGITNATFLNARSKAHEADTEGVCGRDEAGNVFVVFRGTSSRADVATDVDFWGSFHPRRDDTFGGRNVHLHDGFMDAYRPVRDAMLQCVAAHVQHFNETAAAANKTSQQPWLWVGGHSLGAALATLAATDLARAGYKPLGYVIGAPRVGDKNYRELFDEELGLRGRFFRLVNNDDPVPRVPIMGLGYRHVGTLVAVKANEAACQILDKDQDCRGLCKVDDHYTDQYLNATWACVEGDGSINTTACPGASRFTRPVNYDLVAADPGQGTLVNDSAAILAARSGAGQGAGGAPTAARAAAVSGLLAAVLALGLA